ncbi:hypothetical protein M0Q97_08690 [Candidatus Dojkabacteria bacterium]|jgi:hypothetical protein|nr:hypothetical protein [Candidatus Dojkabacteria bacterium]
MGRLSFSTSLNTTINTGFTNKLTSNVHNTDTITGITNLNVYNFIDINGNITQIEKKEKERFKYYITPSIPENDIVQSCVIGINNPLNGDCTIGMGLGLGDDIFGYAKYE